MRTAISIISDSISFLRKYFFLMIFSLILVLLNQFAIWSTTRQDSAIRYAAEVASWFFSVFVELVICLFIYKVKGILAQGSTLFENVRKYFPKVLGVVVVGGVSTILSSILFGFPFFCLFAFLAIEFPYFFFWIWFFVGLFLWVGYVSLSIRLLIFNYHETVWNLVKMGLRELNKNLHFYFQVFLGSIILTLVADFLIYFILTSLLAWDTVLALGTAHRLSGAINLPLGHIIVTLAFLRKNFGSTDNTKGVSTTQS